MRLCNFQNHPIKFNFDIIYNKLQLKKYSNSSTTCGRWVVARVLCLLKDKMNLKQFLKFMIDLKSKFKKNLMMK